MKDYSLSRLRALLRRLSVGSALCAQVIRIRAITSPGGIACRILSEAPSLSD